MGDFFQSSFDAYVAGIILYKSHSNECKRLALRCAVIKGTMSSQTHVRVDEKHFEIVGTTFSNTVGVQEAVLISLNRVRSLVITDAVCCDIFESFCNG